MIVAASKAYDIVKLVLDYPPGASVPIAGLAEPNRAVARYRNAPPAPGEGPAAHVAASRVSLAEYDMVRGARLPGSCRRVVFDSEGAAVCWQLVYDRRRCATKLGLERQATTSQVDDMKTPLETLQAVAFDMDGLMFNTEELYEQVGGELLRRRGKQVTRELLDQMMGRPSPIALQIMIDWHELTDSVVRLEHETDEIFLELLPSRLAPMPGLLDLLDALQHAEIPCAVTTSSRRVFTDRALELSKLSDRFAFVLTCEDITHGKPNPEIYLKAASRFAVEPRRMMVLEDSHIGSRAAVAADAWTVAVPGDHSRDHDFSHVAWVADTLQDPGIYKNLGLS